MSVTRSLPSANDHIAIRNIARTVSRYTLVEATSDEQGDGFFWNSDILFYKHENRYPVLGNSFRNRWGPWADDLRTFLTLPEAKLAADRMPLVTA